LHDGSGLQGPVYYSESAGVHLRHNVCPTGRGIDIIINKIQVNAGAISRYAGVPGDDWDYFTASPFIYPGGSQLSWHDDGSGRSGAYSFYTHPDWNVQWGGELFLLDRSASSLLAEIGQSHPSLVELYCGSHLDNSLENALLMEHGHGRFVFPKPNRLVVIRGDTYHSIRRVEASAGHHARCSVAGFFMAAH
jgi:Rps23 Pro-64 3,4-dihydroxylase Tpa1-like proline 4-hydroxylase